MSFCGFVTFSTSPGADTAERALRKWVSESAASMDVREWSSARSRGCAWTFALVPGADHFATIAADSDIVTVGDVPREWSAGPDGRAKRSRLALAASHEGVDAVVPDSDFAMGLWSETTSRLTLYRCPLGTRALLYVCEPGAWLAFASLPEPLLALPGVRSTIDEAALPSQLIRGYTGHTSAGATLFARLRRLPAGHTLRFTKDALTVEEYWRLPDREPHTFGVNDPEVPRVLRRLLDAAVRRRVAGIGCIGTELSGGLDSSAVTALASTQRDPGARVFAYTIRAHDPHGGLIDPEELGLADGLPAHLGDVIPRGLPHHKTHRPYYLFQREYLERPLPDMVFKFGADHRLLCAARRDGCQVMLTGWGGDEMASARSGLHVLAMVTEGRWALALDNLMRLGGWLGPLRALKSDIASPLWHAHGPSAKWSASVRQQFRAVFEGKPLAPAVSAAPPIRESWLVRTRRRNRVRHPQFQTGLELQDWFGQRAGLAVYHPLLDREVVAFCDGMPAEWVTHLGIKRRAFRAALSGRLPLEALDREKTRLVAPADHPGWRLRYAAHQTRALHDLVASDTWLHQYLNLAVLAEQCAEPRLDETLTGFNSIQQLAAAALVVARCGSHGEARRLTGRTHCR